MDWKLHAEAAIGEPLTTLSRLGGGDFAQSFRAQTDSGHRLFIKTHENPPLRFFSTEAAGLRWLLEAAELDVPAVVAVSDDPPYLALQWIETGAATARGEEEFGRGLARLHQSGFGGFGRPDLCTTGSLAVPNSPADNWVDFYATRRLLPLSRIAAERAALPARALEKLESIADRLQELGGPIEPAALLHGDLWAGNRMIDTGGRSWLIDPAAHGGHREFDLAMMRLFGGFDQRCFDAYNEIYPLAPEWASRVKLHQLAPLVVHAIKFGGSYVAAVEDAVDCYC